MKVNSNKENELTLHAVLAMLSVDPDSGEITQKCGRLAGKKVGSISRTGYSIVKFLGYTYMAHRVVWAICNRAWPQSQIDHIDGNRQNNSRKNLRLASPSENSQNRSMPGSNTSGFKGVTFHKGTGKFQAAIKRDGRFFYLGLYETAEHAHAEYQKAAAAIHGEFANFGARK